MSTGLNAMGRCSVYNYYHNRLAWVDIYGLT